MRRNHPDVERILLTPAQIHEGVTRVARRIARDYAGEDLILVGILKGSVIFLADLLRQLDLPCTVDFVSVTSYAGGTQTSGTPRLLMDLKTDPKGRNILLVEDILDTGLTVRFLLRTLSSRKARSIKVCAFLDKTENRRVKVKADYVGFRIPNDFVVGYGLDYAEHYRNLPYVGVLKPGAVGESRPKNFRKTR
jgi:hypoxanthine phosphoribosyltransferase